MEKDQLFMEKITLIYEKLCNKDLTELTALFFLKNKKTTFKNRKIYLKKCLNNPIFPRNFKNEYSGYDFAKLNIFQDADEFLDISMDDFLSKINSYINYTRKKNTVNIDCNYKYIYIFYDKEDYENSLKLDYYEIIYLESKSQTEVNIEVIPPKNKKSLNIEKYRGHLRYKDNKIIIAYENSHDYISIILNTEMKNSQTKYICGMGTGILDTNEKVPIAKKVALTKNIIKDVDRLYLILNETEILTANENFYKFTNRGIEHSHLEKYIKKIDSLDRFFQKLNQQDNFNTFYKKLAFKEFHSVTKIFNKIAQDKAYYINNRRRNLNALLDSWESEKYNSIYMVLVLSSENNIFEELSDKSIKLQNRFCSFSSDNGINIEIQFIVDNCKFQITEEFKQVLHKFYDSGIKVRFATKSDVEYLVNSMDFLFTDKHNFVIAKQLRVDNPPFYFYRDLKHIEEFSIMYKKIENRSRLYSKDKFKIDLCNSTNPVLKRLVGDWYHYFYGSKIDDDNNIKFWENRVTINLDKSVKYFSNGDIKTDNGKIFIKEKQSIIEFTDIITRRVSCIVFDNDETNLFLANMIDKQYKTNLDMFSIGIFSKEKIDTDEAKNILGDVNKIRLLENYKIKERLTKYSIKKSDYYPDY